MLGPSPAASGKGSPWLARLRAWGRGPEETASAEEDTLDIQSPRPPTDAGGPPGAPPTGAAAAPRPHAGAPAFAGRDLAFLAPAPRTMGTLTAWQAIAAGVALEGEEGAPPPRPPRPAGAVGATGESAARRGSASTSSSSSAASGGEGWQPPPAYAGCGTGGADAAAAGSAGAASPAAAGPTTAAAAAATTAAAAAALDARYELLGELGRGAFGRAFRARRRADGAPCCVKTLDLSAARRRDRGAARREAALLASPALRHPNVVAYRECLVEPGGATQHLVMELCEHGDLEGWLRARRAAGAPLSEAEAMGAFVQLALALERCHAAGVLHRDVKPANIFLSACGVLKLGDFGVATAARGGATAPRTLIGTPHYLAPEQCEGRPYGAAADVWAAGCVLHELCTLRRPYGGGSAGAVMLKIMAGPPAPLPPGGGRPPELRALLARMLSRDPGARPTMLGVLRDAYVQRHLRAYHAAASAFAEGRAGPLAAAAAAFLAPPPPRRRSSVTLAELSPRPGAAAAAAVAGARAASPPPAATPRAAGAGGGLAPTPASPVKHSVFRLGGLAAPAADAVACVAVAAATPKADGGACASPQSNLTPSASLETDCTDSVAGALLPAAAAGGGGTDSRDEVRRRLPGLLEQLRQIMG